MMTPRLRRWGLTAHILSSVGWLGAVAGFLALSIAGLASQDAGTVRAAYLAMNLIGRFVIVPFAFASLLTGLVVSLGTKWGLFRHYWILAKFLINTLGIVILLLHTRLIRDVASAAAAQTLSGEDLRGPRIQLVAIAGAALLALLVATTLAVFKPRGSTPFGRRQQQGERRETQGPILPSNPPARPGPDNETTAAGLPLGLKIFLVVIGVLVAAFVVLHLAGGGLGRDGH